MPNAWFFQANPDYYDVDSYLERYDYIYWSVKVKSHLTDIRLGDDAYLWKSKGSGAGPRGILARCVVSEVPKQSDYEYAENLGDELWLDISKRADFHVGLRIIDHSPAGSVLVPAEQLKADGVLSNLLVLKQQTGTSFRENDSVIVDTLRGLWSLATTSAYVEEESHASSEGLAKLRTHLVRERDALLVKHKKEQFVKEHGHLYCELCNFDFEHFYGDLGLDFIEVHHVVPIAKPGVRTTTLSDLMCVCANCHRMLHRNTNLDQNLDTIRKRRL